MQKVLILGSSGYIGSKLYNHLVSKKYQVNGLDINWYGESSHSLYKDIYDLTIDDIKDFSHIVLLAGHSSVGMSENNMISVLNNNVVNFCKLLDLISDEQKLIYASSSSVYGDTKNSVVNEEYVSFLPNNHYDLSKYEIDAYAKLSGKQYYALRFGTVNGSSPNLRADIMINAMVTSAQKNGRVLCFNPETNRPILGIRDLVRAIDTIITKGTKNNIGVYNLASFNSNALDISKGVSKELNVPLEILEEKKTDITNVKLETKKYDFLIDSSKFKKEFGFEFEETISSIIKSLIDSEEIENRQGRKNAKLYRDK
jgi:UDP-glucuronate 4-epimerase